MKTKWFQINIEYWTTNKNDWERLARKISKPLKGHLVSETKVYVNSELRLKTKKWWQFWK